MTLWDPQQFGRLQQQAAGYLFPMGPFFWLGRLAALEPWVIQRLWIGAVAVVAFLGTVRLAGRLGIGTPWTRVAAGLAYAASPAGLHRDRCPVDEFLPAAMLPWILLPLVRSPGRGGRRGIAAVRSAAAVGLCGGVNATATIAVLIPAVLYVLTLGGQRRRWRMLGLVVPGSGGGHPLVVGPAGAAVAVRRLIAPVHRERRHHHVGDRPVADPARDRELGQLPGGERAAVVAARATGSSPGAVPTLLTGLVAGLGLAGLARPRLPGRRFLLCLLLGRRAHHRGRPREQPGEPAWRARWIS